MARSTAAASRAVLAVACSAPAGSDPGARGTAALVRLFSDRASISIATSFDLSRAPLLEAGLAPAFARRFEESEGEDAERLGFSATGATFPPPRIAPGPAPGGGSTLRFDAPAGVAVWWVPAAPDTRYVLRCAAHRELGGFPRDGESPADFDDRAGVGAIRVWELPRTVREMPREDRRLEALERAVGLRVAEHRSAPPAGAGFEPIRIEFQSSLGCRSLAIVLCAGWPGWWQTEGAAAADPPPGVVEFDDLELFALPLRNTLQGPLRTFPRDPAGLAALREEPDLREVLIGEATLGGATRPSIHAPGETRIAIPLELPRGPFRLRLAYGVADEQREGWGAQPTRFAARLERGGTRAAIALPRATLQPGVDVADAGWHEATLAGEGAGEAATLVLQASAATGSLDTAVFAEPTLTALRASPGTSVVLVSIDTLRADHLGCYGYARADGVAASPRIDALAREAVVFERARSLTPYTLPSHVTMLTGLHPEVHGVERFDHAVQPRVHPLLAQRFADAGFATAAFAAGVFLAPIHGFHHGFDRFSHLDPFLPAESRFRDVFPRHGDRAFNDAMFARCDAGAIERFVAGHRDQPFFLFVHTYVVHGYEAPRELEERFGVDPAVPAAFQPSEDRRVVPAELENTVNRYDATLAAVDAGLGRVLDALDACGLRERTIVAVTSDHGEEFGDHGGFGHGRTLHRELLEVPLIVRLPGRTPSRVADAVTLADLAPALLAWSGVEPAPSADGAPRMVRALDQELEPRVETAHLDEPTMGYQRSIELGGFKLIHVERVAPEREWIRLREFELYDLRSDPNEQVDLLLDRADDPAVKETFARLRQRLEDRFEQLARERAELGVDAQRPAGVVNPHLDEMGYGAGGGR